MKGPDRMAGPVHRLAVHVLLALRASRATAVIALIGGIALPLLLPVTQAWLVASVAVLAALIAAGLIAFDRDGSNGPSGVADIEAALERATTPGLLAHALLRAALVLGALATGLALGGLLPGAQP